MDPTKKAIIDGLSRHVVTAAGGGGIVATSSPAIDFNAGPTIIGLPLGTWVAMLVFLSGAVSSVVSKIPDRAP